MVAELGAGATFALHPPAVITLLERLVTFLPFGVLTHREFARRQFRQASLWAGGFVLAFALAIEALQIPVEGRHARLSDLMVAVALGAAGILISGWVGEPPARANSASP